MKYIEHIGKTYGKLTVLKFDHRDGDAYFLCSCSCGNNEFSIVSGSDLARKNSTSCGICRRFELVGKTFGKLTVLKYDHTKKAAGTSHNYFLCSCSGSSENHTVIITGNNLLSGQSTQCRACANKTRDLIGKNEQHLLTLKAKELNVTIERQVTFKPYVVDGYCRETNTIFEVYEKHHDKTAAYDLKRQQELMQRLNCNFVIIHDRSH